MLVKTLPKSETQPKCNQQPERFTGRQNTNDTFKNVEQHANKIE